LVVVNVLVTIGISLKVSEVVTVTVRTAAYLVEVVVSCGRLTVVVTKMVLLIVEGGGLFTVVLVVEFSLVIVVVNLVRAAVVAVVAWVTDV
jgi:hypothetical protein